MSCILQSILPLEAIAAQKPEVLTHPRTGIELAPPGGGYWPRPLSHGFSHTDVMASSGIQLAVRSLQFVRPYRRPLVTVIILALVLATLSALDPLLMKYLFDQLATPGGAHAFAVAMAGLLALELVRAGLQGWLGMRSWDVRLGVEYSVREQVVSKLNSLPIAFHQEKGVGG